MKYQPTLWDSLIRTIWLVIFAVCIIAALKAMAWADKDMHGHEEVQP